MFKRLTAEQALQVFDAATGEEKETLAPYLRRKTHGQGRAFHSKALDALRAMGR